MNALDIVRIENELFTALVIETLSKQRDSGKKKGEFLLDRKEIEEETQNRLKRYLRGEKDILQNSL